MVFARMAKQVTVDLELMADKDHLGVGLEAEKVVMAKVEVKETPGNRNAKRPLRRW